MNRRKFIMGCGALALAPMPIGDTARPSHTIILRTQLPPASWRKLVPPPIVTLSRDDLFRVYGSKLDFPSADLYKPDA